MVSCEASPNANITILIILQKEKTYISASLFPVKGSFLLAFSPAPTGELRIISTAFRAENKNRHPVNANILI
jgi:hypothetical protein